MPLLPAPDKPRITRVRELSTRAADDLDAILVLAPADVTADLLDSFPEPERWRDLHARTPPRPGTVRTTALSNRRQTLAVLGYLPKGSSPFELLTLAGRMTRELSARGVESLGLITLQDAAAGQSALEALLSAALAHAFALPVYRKRPAAEKRLRRITLVDSKEFDLRHTTASANANNLSRWLTALPPNELDARGYRRAITQLARDNNLTMRWLDEAALKKLGANAFLAVSRGNDEPVAGIAHLKYRPPRKAQRAPDIALVGKGILFDTGGINLKPHRSMLDMHTDMAGSAVALATLLALAELRAPFAVDAWLAITENRIGPHAYRPQEIITAANGVTIQTIHTDAEGRMALADTLVLAGQTRPRFIIDFATLTGACVYALTDRMSGVFTNRPELTGKLIEAGRASGERVWNFPFDADYDSDLESKIADVVQCAVDGKGDHIIAARFLSRFVPENIAWAHVDLSSATRSGGLGHINTEITGFGVRYTLDLLLKQNILAGLEAPA